MKLGWLIWYHEDDIKPYLLDYCPDYVYKSVQIVYTEIIK